MEKRRPGEITRVHCALLDPSRAATQADHYGAARIPKALLKRLEQASRTNVILAGAMRGGRAVGCGFSVSAAVDSGG